MAAPAATTGALPIPPISPKGKNIIVVLSFLYIISLTLIVLRFLAKYRVKSIGLEDWASLAAFTCLTVYYGETMYIMVDCYAGFHILQLEAWQIEKLLKVCIPLRAMEWATFELTSNSTHMPTISSMLLHYL